MKKSEVFTAEMLECFECKPHAERSYYSIGEKLSDVYGSYSNAKVDAYNYCKRLCRRFNGFDFAIRSKNTNTFSVNFRFVNPLNGKIMLAIITRWHNNLYFE